MILNDQGWITEARCCPSPNTDKRPDETDIDLLVIHNISLPPGEYGGAWIDDLFLNRLDSGAHPYFREICQLQVSSHLLIRRDGELVQYAPLQQRAWHAGVSQFQERERCNDFAIGIELEGCDEEPYTNAQYQTLITATRTITTRYPAITTERIVGHSDIAPGRKTDPGPAFDWQRFISGLASES
ncbi:MAG: 1,6-anhydro-N-acetylmuramyl-L-alanine amidase AmpD [Gammaproteobacteria bacterium]|nr:1,6-anhydro-N-acetylmuramyl-L-alanine amidase AmpD [Gammaproteobacteria bacterium]